MDEESVRQVSARFYEAASAVMCGDASPMLALWSQQDDATYLDPRGGFQQGWEALRAYWEYAAQLNQDAPGEIAAAGRMLKLTLSGQLAYTVMVEEIRQVGEHGSDLLESHATNIYRFEAGEWRMIHRHADTVRAVSEEA